MKDPHNPQEPMAQWADRVLRQLPARPAPPGLAPLILAAVGRQGRRPWYRQPWLQWPAGLRVLSGVLVGAAFVALWWFLLPRADAVGSSAAQMAALPFDVLRPFAAVSNLLAALGRASLLVVRGLNNGVVVAAVAAVALVWSTTLGLGTACWRMAAGQPQHP